MTTQPEQNGAAPADPARAKEDEGDRESKEDERISVFCRRVIELGKDEPGFPFSDLAFCRGAYALLLAEDPDGFAYEEACLARHDDFGAVVDCWNGFEP